VQLRLIFANFLVKFRKNFDINFLKENTGSQNWNLLFSRTGPGTRNDLFWGRTGTKPEPEVLGETQEPPNPGLALVWYSSPLV